MPTYVGAFAMSLSSLMVILTANFIKFLSVDVLFN